jgi:hypothetical protein
MSNEADWEKALDAYNAERKLEDAKQVAACNTLPGLQQAYQSPQGYGVCPNCGHCPTCGRQYARPWYPQPWSPWPNPIWCGTSTVGTLNVPTISPIAYQANYPTTNAGG